MKEIVMADCMGQCFGVENALSVVDRTMTRDDDRVYVLGSLVHNPQTIERLKKQGLKFIKQADNVYDGTVIISAHGAPKETIRMLDKRGIKIIDATCPVVKDVHSRCMELEKEGRLVVILGDKEHAEIKAMTSYLNRAKVASDADHLTEVIEPGSRVALLSQTTQNRDSFDKAANKLKGLSHDHKVFNTICDSTRNRQQSAKKTAAEVDMMLVIGGYNSANTARLSEICSRIVETKHIETAEELRQEWFKNIKKIGITAGASTPAWIIDDVVERIKRFD